MDDSLEYLTARKAHKMTLQREVTKSIPEVGYARYPERPPNMAQRLTNIGEKINDVASSPVAKGILGGLTEGARRYKANQDRETGKKRGPRNIFEL